MAFVPIKSEEQQRVLVLHRSRDLLVRQRTSSPITVIICSTSSSDAERRSCNRPLDQRSGAVHPIMTAPDHIAKPELLFPCTAAVVHT